MPMREGGGVPPMSFLQIVPVRKATEQQKMGRQEEAGSGGP